MQSYYQKANVSTHRLWDGPNAGKWLVTINTELQSRSKFELDDRGRSLDTAPQCLCVVDDFGNLVPVRGWH